MASIAFTDALGPAIVSNSRLAPGNRFRNWTPRVKPIGPVATGLGTGRLFRFKYRDDNLVSFDVEAIPATSLDTVMRLMLHLMNGGKVSLDATEHALYTTYATCTLAPDTEPQLSFTDSRMVTYTLSLVLKADIAEITDPFFDLAAAVPGMVFWYKPETLAALPTESLVGTWPDSCGLSHHATQTNSNKGIYRTGQVNGMPGVYFASGACLQVPTSVWTGKTAAEIFYVMKRDADPPPTGGTAGFCFLGNDTTNEARVPNESSVIVDNFGTNSYKTTVNPTPALTTPRIYSALSAPGEWTNWLDGDQLYTTATNTVSFNTVHQRIGGGYPGSPVPDQKYHGYFSEIPAWGRKLTDDERFGIVYPYLAAKFGTTVNW